MKEGNGKASCRVGLVCSWCLSYKLSSYIREPASDIPLSKTRKSAYGPMGAAHIDIASADRLREKKRALELH